MFTKNTRLFYFFSLLVSANLFFSSAYSRERILYYGSRIEVHKDGSIKVTETIKVQAEGNQISHGIFRAFPTRYNDRYGNRVKVSYELEQVMQDSSEASYFMKKEGNRLNVYIGDANTEIEPGEHTYEIIYTVPRQVGFYDGFDEIYWNITGNEWAFAIEKAEATIVLPPGATATRKAAYSGVKGSTGCDCAITVNADGTVSVSTTGALSAGEGLTVGIGWPKGFVSEPAGFDKFKMFLLDNLFFLICLLGLIASLLYYWYAWVKVGIDPDEGAIIPLFGPPEGFSPEAVRFVWKMGYDNRAFAAAVVNMAVNGYLHIEEKNDDYTLVKKLNNNAVLSKAEKAAADKLFSLGVRLELDNRNHSIISRGISALKEALSSDFEKAYFRNNYSWMIPGVIITIVTLGALTYVLPDESKIFACWISVWTMGSTFLLFRAISQWAEAGGIFGSGSGKAWGASFFALPFLAGELVALYFFSRIESPLAAISLVALMANNVVFYFLLKAPTIAGGKIMEQIKGFRMYLNVAEKERLNLLNPPEKTPALFEKFLPYAIALDAEQAWGDQFSQVIEKAIQAKQYTPTWYYGTMSWNHFNAGSFSSSIGSAFVSSLASSAVAPGSSGGGGGSGGGGSSGGGGGGGGGGGW